MTKVNSSDELEIFKTAISLPEYASSLGYERVEKKCYGKTVFMRSGTDRITISTMTNGHAVYSTIDDDKNNGSIIDFVQKKEGVSSLGEVRKILRPWAGIVEAGPKIKKIKENSAKKNLQNPPISSSSEEKKALVEIGLAELKQYKSAYLSKQRGLSDQTLQTFSAQLKEDSRSNACFIHSDQLLGQTTGWERKNEAFTGFMGTKALFMHKVDESQPTKGLIIFEAAIDVMSFFELGEFEKTDLLVSIGGAPTTYQIDLLLELAKRTRYAAIAVDNDDAGDKLAARLETLFTENRIEYDRLLPKNSDWNDDLIEKKEVKMGFKTHIPRAVKSKKTTAQTVVHSTNKNPVSSKSATPIVPPKHLQDKAQAARLEGQAKDKAHQKELGNGKENDADQDRSIVEPLDLSQFFNSAPEPLDFIWKGGPLAGTVGALVSPGGAGKSFFILQAAAAIAAKEAPSADLLGLEPTKGGIVNYYVLEDPVPVIWHRLHALKNAINSNHAQTLLIENLKIRSLIGAVGFDLSFHDQAEQIIQESKNSRLIIIDTLSRSHTLDENKNGEMAGLLKELEFIAKETGAAVIFLHHSNKSSAREGLGTEQQSARGASVLIDNARWGAFVQTMTPAQAQTHFEKMEENPVALVDDELRKFFILYGVNKQNYGKPVSDIWLERKDGNGGILTPVDLLKLEKSEQIKNLKSGRNRKLTKKELSNDENW